MPGHAIGPPPGKSVGTKTVPGSPSRLRIGSASSSDGAVAVVERDGEDAAAVPLAHRLRERPAGVAAVDQEPGAAPRAALGVTESAAGQRSLTAW